MKGDKIMKTKYGNAKIGNMGYYVITSYKEGNHRKLLHRLIWEDFYNTEVPKGYDIHHKNEDKLDNCILNLQLIRHGEHRRLHMAGENHHFYGKTFSDEHKQKISESLTGRTISEETKKKISESEKGHIVSEETKKKISKANTKNYYRIVKGGLTSNGKQNYGIIYNGKFIKRSISKEKLIKWFNENYSNKELIIYE